MKRFFQLLLLCLLPCCAFADNFVNLTPYPKQMTVGEGELLLPRDFVVNCNALADSVTAEAQKFVDVFNHATGYNATVAATADGALVNLALKENDAAIGDEGYRLDITAEGVSIEAGTTAGFFYAFQTLKKILPTNVMAGAKDEAVTRYALPIVSIVDAPRYKQRSFMLDVSRHFFTVEEVKRMLDLMACYKMNAFHWHLTDDQGWRVEIKKWPKLTELGSIAPNSRFTDMNYGQYWINRPYGPYFYTQEELKEVVAYAQNLHIDIIPEIDMPGHFVAALHAYPEFSCSPEASHTVWIDGGISSDVLNVANPQAVQFAKDILGEIMDIFPGEYIHIGGDECPTSAWERNADCQKMKEDLGLPNFRQLQSQFIKEVGGYINERGRKVAVWNEAITANGVDTKIIQDVDAIVYCWTGADNAANKASQLGLKAIYTPQPRYYINRKQRPDDYNAGDGSDNVQNVYGVRPYASAHGIQGTFWAEHVSEPEHLEYQALPRLIAIAEAAWTPQAKRNFTDFCNRITADSTMLNYNNYYYNRDYMVSTSPSTDKVMPKTSTAEKQYWYRLVTRATGDRTNKCIELLKEGSSLISQYSGKGAQAGRLWQGTLANEGDDNFDYQYWAVEEDPANAGRYALVSKAFPEGSLKGTATAANNTGRWEYDATAKHYDFILGDNVYGQEDNLYYYSIRSSRHEGQYMNAAGGGQGYSINLWADPSDGNSGHWTFNPLAAAEGAQAVVEQLNSAKSLLAAARTYEGENKVVGCYSATAAAALRNIVENAGDPEALSAADLEKLQSDLTAALTAFHASLGMPEKDVRYRINNTVEGFNATAIADNGGNYLHHTTDAWAANAWEVTSSTQGNDGTCTLRLRNAVTGKYISGSVTTDNSYAAYPVQTGTTGHDIVATFNVRFADFTLSSTGKNLFPLDPASTILPGGVVSSGIKHISSGNTNAVRPMGTGWNFTPVCIVTYVCKDDKGNNLGTFSQSAELGKDYTAAAPELPNLRVKSYDGGDAPVFTAIAEDKTVQVVYERVSYAVSIICRDSFGGIISVKNDTCKVGENYTLNIPEHPYYTFDKTDYEGETSFVPTEDLTISATYTTDAISGASRAAEAVAKLEAGRSYLVYDATGASGRNGYINISPSLGNKIITVDRKSDYSPYYTWTLERAGTVFRVKNEYTELYIPQLGRGSATIASTTGDTFRFTLNTDGISFTGQSTTNSRYWNGNEGSPASMTGWDDAHPYKFFEYYVQPYFRVAVSFVNEAGESLAETQHAIVKAGDAFTLETPVIENHSIVRIDGGEQLVAVGAHLTVSVIYKDESTGIDSIESTEKSSAIYDLSGRRLGGINRPGIYIVGGRKVLVR